MAKTLTEQWRDGTLPEDCYYILTKNGHIKKERTCFYSYTDEQCFSFMSNKDIEEVLAPVPSYDEYKRLQEQLKSANNAMKAMLPFAHNYSKERIEKYLEKWGVK